MRREKLSREKDYNSAFNSAMYSVTKDRQKRAKRRANNKNLKKYRMRHSKDGYFGYYVIDEKLVPVDTKLVTRVKKTPEYEVYFDATTGNYSRKFIGMSEEEYTRKVKIHDYVKVDKPYLKHFYVSGNRELGKRRTNEKLRNNKTLDIGKAPGNYKKVYDYWSDVY